MNFLNRPARFLRFLALPLCLGAAALSPAAEPQNTQRSFAEPQEAVDALKAATEAKDQAALRALFGPELPALLTGDAVQDANNAKGFATIMTQRTILVKDGKDKLVLEAGPNEWPLPIPLVKTGGRWHFDTAAGKEEIINRHIGKDELHAIGVCRDYVDAQRHYAATNPQGTYAQRLRSTPGKKDGLYWPSAKGDPASPFGPLAAEAQAEGYARNAGTRPHPFHGYFFRILTQQGAAAPGGKRSYLNHGDLTGGFALVAYPEHWGQSGIMTFLVNQDGKVYQRNLGEKTSEAAAAIQEYNPDGEWTFVRDKGILKAACTR